LTLWRWLSNTRSHTAVCGAAGPQCFIAHSDSVLLLTMNRLPNPRGLHAQLEPF
jgi:hypothetical protein